MRAPGPALVAAVRARGLPVAISRDAGRYLCNYLCWHASAVAATTPHLRLAAFVHVPTPRRSRGLRTSARRRPVTPDELVRAGEAILIALAAAARRHG
jgi:pyroglutamyl-peptidase